MLNIREVTDHMTNEEYRKYVILHKSNHSYALNRQLPTILSNKSWEGKPCFIIAGGESVKSVNLNNLLPYNTIGLNLTFLLYSATINYSMDSDFYDQIYAGNYNEQHNCNVMEKWNEYQGLKVLLTPMELRVFAEKNVYLIRRQIIESTNFAHLDNGIYGGKSSAVGAINLALALGARKIFLLGYDMTCGEKTHWHGGYPKRDIREFRERLKTYRDELEELAPSWTKIGANIFNLNPKSELKCFPFKTLSEALKEV